VFFETSTSGMRILGFADVAVLNEQLKLVPKNI
jgi:hypothetical protein